MAKNKDNVNADQAAKSNNGKLNNIENTRFFSEKWADGIHKFFMGAEVPGYSHIPILGGLTTRDYQYQMDQVLLLDCDRQNTVLIVYIDGTTTHRGERVCTKTNEGVVVMYTTNDIETKILEQYPQLAGRKFVHICGIVYPDELSAKLKKKAKEEHDVDKFCVAVNYKTGGKYVTADGKYGLDYSARKTDLARMLDDVYDNQDSYVLDKNILAYAWIRLYPDDFYYMPNLTLCDLSAVERRDHLIYCLEKNIKYYTTIFENGMSQLDCFLNIHKIPYTRLTLNSIKKRKVIAYLKKNFPAQTELSILSAVYKEYYGKS